MKNRIKLSNDNWLAILSLLAFCFISTPFQQLDAKNEVCLSSEMENTPLSIENSVNNSKLAYGQVIYIKTSQGKYLSAPKAGDVKKDIPKIGSMEQFLLVNPNKPSDKSQIKYGDQVSLYSFHHKYVTFMSGWGIKTVTVNQTTIGDMEKFTIVHPTEANFKGSIISSSSFDLKAWNNMSLFEGLIYSYVLELYHSQVANSEYIVKITKLVCKNTDDSGEDEVFMNIYEPNFERIPKTHYRSMNEDSDMDTWTINRFFKVKGWRLFSLRFYEDEKLLGELKFKILGRKLKTSKTYNGTNGSKYILSYEVEKVNTNESRYEAAVTLFEHTRWGGRTQNFSQGSYNKTDLNSSSDGVGSNSTTGLRIKQGTVVTVFDDGNFQGKFRTYTNSTGNLGEEMNDVLSSLVVADANDFAMIIASDSQYPRTRTYDAKDENGYGNNSKAQKDNQEHVKSMNKLIDEYPVMGVIMNGDITEFGQGTGFFAHDELGWIKQIYGKLNTAFYPGLGNHDYDNNVDDCVRNNCAIRMINYIRQFILDMGPTSNFDFSKDGFRYKGSLSYSWDIGNVHFIQLHNYASYENKIVGSIAYDYDVLNKSDPVVGIETYNITPSFDWLEKDAKKAREQGKYIILNFHSNENVDRDPKLAEIIDKYKISAVFVGHTHRVGRSGNIGTAPVFYGGASFWHTYMLVQFRGDKMIYNTVNSTDGKAVFFKKGDELLNFQGENYVKSFDYNNVLQLRK